MKFILFHILTTLPLFVVGNTNINDEVCNKTESLSHSLKLSLLCFSLNLYLQLAKLNLQMAEMKENLHSLKKSIWDVS